MDKLQAGLAALAVIGPAIGVGMAAAAAVSAIGRNPEAAGAIRGVFIIGAAFAASSSSVQHSQKASAFLRSCSASFRSFSNQSPCRSLARR